MQWWPKHLSALGIIKTSIFETILRYHLETSILNKWTEQLSSANNIFIALGPSTVVECFSGSIPTRFWCGDGFQACREFAKKDC